MQCLNCCQAMAQNCHQKWHAHSHQTQVPLRTRQSGVTALLVCKWHTLMLCYGSHICWYSRNIDFLSCSLCIVTKIKIWLLIFKTWPTQLKWDSSFTLAQASENVSFLVISKLKLNFLWKQRVLTSSYSTTKLKCFVLTVCMDPFKEHKAKGAYI